MKNHHSVPRKFPNLTVVKLEPDPTQIDEDPSFIELKVTTQMLNVLNAAKAWARQTARAKKTRAKMSQQERTLFDAMRSTVNRGRDPGALASTCARVASACVPGTIALPVRVSVRSGIKEAWLFATDVTTRRLDGHDAGRGGVQGFQGLDGR